jgi:4'-phosphopantetheinyl transferase
MTDMHTSAVGWLIRSLADVPPDDGWLGAREHDVLAGLRGDKRRREWRLGRCAAKAVVAEWVSVTPEQVEILPAPNGAPQTYVDGEAAPVALSLSHRADRALAVVADASCEIGCDLEKVEPRSRAFVERWLTLQERAALKDVPASSRRCLANVMWTAKEAAAKARADGLLDTRHASATLDGLGGTDLSWRGLSVSLGDQATIAGWWRAEPGWVMAIAAEPPTAAPVGGPP